MAVKILNLTYVIWLILDLELLYIHQNYFVSVTYLGSKMVLLFEKQKLSHNAHA